MAEIFIRYWKRGIISRDSKRECWQLRSVIYGLLFGLYAVVFFMSVTARPCNEALLDLQYSCWLLLYSVFPVDFAILALSCYRRALQLSSGGNSVGNGAVKQALLFAILPFCFGAGFGMIVLFPKQSQWTIFIYLIPSIIMLYLMWARNYVALSRDCLSLQDLENEWQTSNVAYGSEMTDLQSPRELNHPSLSSSVRGQNVANSHTRRSSVKETDVISNMRRDLRYTAPLVNVFEAKLHMNEELESSKDNGVNSHAAGLAPLSEQTENLVIKEILRPASQSLVLVRLFLSNVALDQLEHGYQSHADLTSRFIEKSAPSISGTLGNLDLHRQHEELTSQCEDLNQRYADHIKLMHLVAENIGGGNPKVGGDSNNDLSQTLPFKSSQQKKSRELAFLATNCNVHVSTLSNIRTKTNHGASDAESIPIASITFGAPSAHVLGFKFGGLRSVLAKLDEEEEKSVDVSPKKNQKQQSLDAAFKSLELRFVAKARESIVLSQALCAVVAAGMQVLTECLGTKSSEKIRQFSSIGLLCHSVCLLSTSGKEEGMIEDFSGAYAKLRITIRFECQLGNNDKLAIAGDGFRIINVEPTKAAASPEVNIGAVTVTLGVSSRADYAWLCSTVVDDISAVPSACESPEIALVPVLFNLGVNEMQSVANASGSTRVQTEVNLEGLAAFRSYHDSFIELPAQRQQRERESSQAGDGEIPLKVTRLLNSLAHLVKAEARDRAKLVDLLLVSSYAARAMHGARTTSCKSAKDRTSVFQTLEVARIAERHGWLDRFVPTLLLDRVIFLFLLTRQIMSSTVYVFFSMKMYIGLELAACLQSYY